MKIKLEQHIISKIVILFVTILFTLPAWSQKSKFASLSFENLGDSIEKYVQNDYAKGLKFSKAYLEKAQEEKNLKKEGQALEYIASSHLYNNQLKYAKETFATYLQLAKKTKNDELYIRAHILGSDLELNTPNGAQAAKYLDIALKKARESNNKMWTEIVLNKKSLLLTINGETEKAIQAHKRTVNYLMNKETDSIYTEEVKNGNVLAAIFMLCHSYRTAKNLDSAKYYHSKMQPYVSGASSCSQMYYHINKGENAFEEGQYKEAKKSYQHAQGLCDKDMPLFDLNMTFRYGKIENKLGNYKETIRILKKGLDDYGVKPNEEGYMDEYYKILAGAYKETGDFELANTYFEKYINTKKEFSQIQDDISSTLREKEIKEFKAELKKLEEEKRSKNIAINILILGSSVSILILLMLLLRFYRIRKRNEVRFEHLMSKLKEKENKVIDSKDIDLEESSTNEIAADVTHQILTGLTELEEKKYYLRQDCNSYNVAKKIKTNTSYLSKVVNQEFEKNFNTYINDLRINHAIIQLKEDNKFRSYSIQSIAEEIGYKSADSFTKYFKLRTGLNPSFYIKQLNQL